MLNYERTSHSIMPIRVLAHVGQGPILCQLPSRVSSTRKSGLQTPFQRCIFSGGFPLIFLHLDDRDKVLQISDGRMGFSKKLVHGFPLTAFTSCWVHGQPW